MKYSNQLQNLGTETAFAVSAQAKEWAEKGNKVYPFHLGDINLPTPENIVEATIKSIKDGKSVSVSGGTRPIFRLYIQCVKGIGRLPTPNREVPGSIPDSSIF